MSDLISRQAMIDAMRRRKAVFSKNKVEYSVLPKDEKARVDEIDNCISDLVNAPNAEPEPEEFEWCHDCKEYDQERHCCHRWTKVIRQTVEEMKAEPERKTGKWIWTDGVRCSRCYYKLQTTGIPRYCPNCGCYNGGENEQA